jgi:hypothetical protein
MNERTHKGPGPAQDSPPRYFECPACGFLSDDPLFESPDLECPACSASGEMRRAFPAERTRRLDARTRRYNEEGESEALAAKSMRLHDQAYRLFVLMNNEHVATLGHRAHDEFADAERAADETA